MKYGQGTFTVKARMELYKHFIKAEEDHRYLCLLHGVEPQSMFTDKIKDMICAQWEKDLQEKPWLEDAPKLDLFYAEIDGKDGWQMTINTDHESLYELVKG